jgi:putative DNA primase/helicase
MKRFVLPKPNVTLAASVKPSFGHQGISGKKSNLSTPPPDPGSKAAAPAGPRNGGTSKINEAGQLQNKTYNNSKSGSRDGKFRIAFRKPVAGTKTTTVLTAAGVAKALGGVVSGKRVLAPGPGHSPKDRSLSVKLDPKAPDGFVVKPFSPKDNWKTAKDHVRKKLKLPSRATSDTTVVATYIYRQPDGTPHLRVQRTRGKAFWQSRWDGHKWEKGKPSGPKIPYRQPELIAAAKDAPVFIVEGEKDADRLTSLGLIATTASEGAGNWTPDLNRWFEGRIVYVLADNDGPGREHAHKVACNLKPVAASVRFVELQGLPEKGEVSDWLDADRTRTAKLLSGICQEVPEWTEQQAADATEMDDDINEDSVALEFARRLNGEFRYCHDGRCWYRWDGNRWRKDKVGAASTSVRELARELSQNRPEKVRQQTSRRAFVLNVEAYAKNDPAIAVTADHWDNDPYLLGTPTRTVDLKTGQLRPATPTDRITKSTIVSPAESVDCPRFLEFLAESTGGDAEQIRLLQQYFGYALTGDTSQQCLLFLYGPGGNGKTALQNTVVYVMGEYAVTAAMDTFVASKGDRHTTDLAMLQGKRLATASETRDGRHLDEARIKLITGGDLISARFMRQDNITFRPQCKLFIIGNHMPQLRNVDPAMRRRIIIVPFVRTPEKRDKQLETKLRSEAPGILRWMIEGSLDWQQNGLTVPQAIQETTDAYFAEQDLLGQWLSEKCEADPGNQSRSETTADLYASWSEYAKRAGEDPGTTKSFSTALAMRGFRRKATTKARMFVGLRLRPKHTLRMLPPPPKVQPKHIFRLRPEPKKPTPKP